MAKSTVQIEKVDNGYIVQTPLFIYVYSTLEEALNYLLLHYEGRSETFSGNSYGKVVIVRSKKDKEEDNV